MAVSPSYKELIQDYPAAFFLSVTATPYTAIRHLVDEIVRPIPISKLIEQGHLVPPRYFCPSRPDLSGIRTSSATKDYVQDELAEKMDTSTITGDVVTHWQKLAENRPTLAFAVTVNHSKNLSRSFNDAGIPARHVDADTPDFERAQAIAALERGELKVITNVGILGVGVDIPAASCLVLARPTKSFVLYVQQIGRGTRPCGEKKDFIVLDHAGNVERHGFIEDEPAASVDKELSRVSKVRVCTQCFRAYEGRQCPHCEPLPKMISAEARDIRIEPGELRELTRDNLLVEAREFFLQCQEEAKRLGYRPGWAYIKLKEQFGETVARQLSPKRAIPSWLLARPSRAR